MTRFDCRTLALLSALLLQMSAALAQNDEDEEYLALAYGDKATVSIATGSQQSLRRAPAVASVITAEDIAAMGATNLDEVLEGIPGMHVSRTASYSPVYGIRGIQSNPTDSRTLMLQNGVPMTTLYLGDKGQTWGGLPLENVARIEIVRGPGSALYGADAYAGVINIITKAAADTPGTEFGARAGSFRTGSAWLQHGGKTGPVEVAAYLRIGSTDGSNGIITADAQTARDRTFGSNASLAPGQVHTGHDDIDGGLDLGYDKWRLRAGYKLRDRLGVGAGIASTLDPLGQNRSERVTTDLSWADPFFAKDWGAGFTASYLHYAETLAANYQLLPPGTVLPTGAFPNGMIGHPDRFERQLRLSTFVTYAGIKGHSLRLGLGHDDLNMYETGTHKNYLLNASGVPVPTGPVIDYSGIQPHLMPQRRKLSYFYVQDEWQFARDWALTAGVRHDSFSDFGGTTNPRLALVWDAAQHLTAKLLYGQAFRAPSFNEQYGINPVANGNPSLKPETIRTLEAAFAWQARPDTLVNLSFFRNAMRNIIRALPNASGSGSTFSNAGLQNGRGMELEMVWDASRSLRLTGNYSWQRSIDETTGTDAGYAPHHHLYARADWRFTGNWLASTQVNWIADRKRAAGDTRPDVPDYTTVDLTLRTTNGKNQWDFAGSLRNLFDADAREPTLAPGTSIPNDLPVAPRTFYLQAIFRL